MHPLPPAHKHHLPAKLSWGRSFMLPTLPCLAGPTLLLGSAQRQQLSCQSCVGPTLAACIDPTSVFRWGCQSVIWNITYFLISSFGGILQQFSATLLDVQILVRQTTPSPNIQELRHAFSQEIPFTPTIQKLKTPTHVLPD